MTSSYYVLQGEKGSSRTGTPHNFFLPKKKALKKKKKVVLGTGTKKNEESRLWFPRHYFLIKQQQDQREKNNFLHIKKNCLLTSSKRKLQPLYKWTAISHIVYTVYPEKSLRSTTINFLLSKKKGVTFSIQLLSSILFTRKKKGNKEETSSNSCTTKKKRANFSNLRKDSFYTVKKTCLKSSKGVYTLLLQELPLHSLN